MGASAKFSSCCAWPPPCRGLAEVVSVRLNLSNGTTDVRRVCNFLGSILSQQKFELTDVKALSTSQLSDSVTALCSWTDAVIALQQISVTVLC